MGKRSRPNTEIEVDMTPMIDLTFLLIIFFIIVNDLTQKDLEELKLPIAMEAGHDEPPPGRPILNVLGCTCDTPNSHSIECRIGSIVWKKKELYFRGIDSEGRMDPIRKGRADYYWLLADTMATRFVPFMEMKVDPKFPALGALPDDPVLIRADRNTPFKYIARIMETCTREQIRIWRVQLAASEPVKE